jgi:hypothetical protein
MHALIPPFFFKKAKTEGEVTGGVILKHETATSKLTL